ncbi:MAG TPA: alpha/beta hydrolase [Acidimicrobiia bacterium]|nr:alpha/beta hydrolase [Acidimicrobiia bacterium]
MLVDSVQNRFDPVIRMLAIAAGICLLLMAVLWLFQRQLIYLPDPTPGSPPADVTVSTVETSDGIVHELWLIPADGEAVARVLVFNGNAGNKSHRLPLARSLAGEGMEVVLFDYRGYGDTAGSPSEGGLLSDARAVADVAFDTDLPVVYLGESLGAGVATLLAKARAPDALVLRSPFTSLADMAHTHYPFVPTFLLRDRYPVEEVIAGLEIPLLVFLGTDDSIVAPPLSRRVYEMARGPKDLVELEGLDHNDAELASGARLAEEIRVFVDEQVHAR